MKSYHFNFDLNRHLTDDEKELLFTSNIGDVAIGVVNGVQKLFFIIDSTSQQEAVSVALNHVKIYPGVKVVFETKNGSESF